MIRRKKAALLISLLLGLSLSMLITGLILPKAATKDSTDSNEIMIATVNGDPISIGEFNRQLGLLRASVIDEFKQTYDADYGKDFWNTRHDGATPSDVLKRRSLERAVALKIELKLAQSHGLLQGTSEADLLAEMERENQRRSEAARAGQPLYGPLQLNESAFLDFYLSKIRIALQAKLSEEVMPVSDEELLRHYERIKDELFRMEDRIGFSHISVPYRKDGQTEDKDGKRLAEETIEAVKLRVKRGQEVQEAGS